jgi:Ankyrin repeats (3 copies)/Ankyrin repeats (many copies)
VSAGKAMQRASAQLGGTHHSRRTRAALLGLMLGLFVYLVLTRWYAPPVALSRTFDARFEWDAAHGFKSFAIRDNSLGGRGGRLWQYLVAAQVKPGLDHYLRRSRWKRINGHVEIEVTKVVPLVTLDGWLGGRVSVEDPDTTQLTYAAEKGDADAVKKLIAAGAGVNTKDWWGRTPLYHAFDHGLRPEVVKELVAAGADVNARDVDGYSPLLLAASGLPGDDQDLIISELLAAHADVNLRDNYGGTPLMSAASWGNIRAVKLLLAAGADPSVRANDGDTALSLAESRHHAGVAQLLKQAARTR